jgi:hypothetical protein
MILMTIFLSSPRLLRTAEYAETAEGTDSKKPASRLKPAFETLYATIRVMSLRVFMFIVSALSAVFAVKSLI